MAALPGCLLSVGSTISVLVVFFTIISTTSGLYEDQVGKFDWRLQNVGCVEKAFFDTSGRKPSQLFVQTSENVVSALSVATGSIVWRKVLEETGGPVLSVTSLPEGNDVVVVSSSKVRRFQLAGGYLAWEYSLPAQSSNSARVSTLVYGDTLAVLTEKEVLGLSLKTGAEVWQSSIPHLDGVEFGSHASVVDDVLYVVGVGVDSVYVTSVKDEVLAKPVAVPQSSYGSKDQCVLSGKFFACVHGGKDQPVYSVDVAQPAGGFTAVNDEVVAKGSSVMALSDEYLVVKEGITSTVFQATSSKLVKKGSFKGALGIGANRDQQFLFSAAVDQSRRHVSISAVTIPDMTPYGDFAQSVTADVPSPLHTIVPLVIRSRDNSLTFKVLGLFEDCSALMFKKDMVPAWRREEALANIVAVEMVDLPVSDAQASMEEEFGAAKGNLGAQFVSRLISQLAQAYSTGLHLYHRYLLKTFTGQGSSPAATVPGTMMAAKGEEDEEYMTRDSFNIHKMIVVATSRGKLFGLDSYTGQIAWAEYLGRLRPFPHGSLLLYVQRTTAHFPFDPLCTVLGRSKRSVGSTLAYTFNPITGQPAGPPSDTREPQEVIIPFPLAQATMSASTDNHFVRPLVLLGTYGQSSMYPDWVAFSKEGDEGPRVTGPMPQYMFTADPDTAHMEGYRVTNINSEAPSAANLWSLTLGDGVPQRILSLQTKHPAELVHSQGVVMADRTVLYKYINPNLAAIITEETEEVGGKVKGTLNVYLVDTVSGRTVFQCSHKQAAGPVTLVHSENWVVYTYTNERQWRTELAVLDLYEGVRQANASAFTSVELLSSPPEPVVMRKAFVLGMSVTAAAVTLTERGITRKNLLLARTSGGIVEMPKKFVDARRPDVPSQQSQEEGLPPYAPELPFSFEGTINYNQSLARGARILHTAPAGLESTSLVVATGLDLFFTKVAPSQTYDLLKDDFDFFFISLVLLAMVVATGVFKVLAGRKALQKAWK